MPEIEKEIVYSDLTRFITIAKSENLIKVCTIKAKFIDQMPFLGKFPMTNDSPLTIIGECQGYVIVKKENKVYKVSIANFRQYLFDLLLAKNPNDVDSQTIWEIAHDEYDKVPQLFAT